MKTKTKIIMSMSAGALLIMLPLIGLAAPIGTPPDKNVSPTFSGVNITDGSEANFQVNTSTNLTGILGLLDIKYSASNPTYFVGMDSSGLALGYDSVSTTLFSRLNFVSQSATLSSKNGTAESAVNLNGGTLTTKAVDSSGNTIKTVLNGQNFAINDGTKNSLQIARDGTITNANGPVKIANGTYSATVGDNGGLDVKGSIKGDNTIEGEWIYANNNMDVGGVIQNTFTDGSVTVYDGLDVIANGTSDHINAGIHLLSNGAFLDMKNQLNIGASVTMNGYPAAMNMYFDNSKIQIKGGQWSDATASMTYYNLLNINSSGELSNDGTFNNGKFTINDSDGLIVKGPIGRFYSVGSSAVTILGLGTASAAATCSTGDIAVACETDSSLSRITAYKLGRGGTTTTCTGSYYNFANFKGTVKTVASCFSPDG